MVKFSDKNPMDELSAHSAKKQPLFKFFSTLSQHHSPLKTETILYAFIWPIISWMMSKIISSRGFLTKRHKTKLQNRYYSGTKQAQFISTSMHQSWQSINRFLAVCAFFIKVIINYKIPFFRSFHGKRCWLLNGFWFLFQFETFAWHYSSDFVQANIAWNCALLP